MTRPSGVVFAEERDRDRQRVKEVDGGSRGNEMTYASDSPRLVRHTDRAGGITIYGDFDPATELPQSVSFPGGNTTSTFDRQGRPLSSVISAAGGGVFQVLVDRYDALGRPRVMRYGPLAGNSVEFDYDLGGPLREAKWTEFGTTRSVNYDHYDIGPRRRVEYPSGAAMEEERDAGGRLLSVTLSGTGTDGKVWEVEGYFGAHEPATLRQGPFRVTHEYDLRKRLLKARWDPESRVLPEVELRYAYDPTDNPIARQEVHRHGRTDFYHYDAGGRLVRAHMGARPTIAGDDEGAPRRGVIRGQETTEVKRWTAWDDAAAVDEEWHAFRPGFQPGRWQREYQFDQAGLDLPERTELVNPDGIAPREFVKEWRDRDDGRFAERLVDQDGVTFDRARDVRGNVRQTTVLHRAPGEVEPWLVPATLSYDGLNRLIEVQIVPPDGSGGPTRAVYEYRADNLRNRKQVYRGEELLEDTRFVYDGDLLIEEWDHLGSPQVRARYFYADRDVPFAADLRGTGGSLRRYYYATDQVGSVVAVLDGFDGQTMERIGYDPYGQPRIERRDERAPGIWALRVIDRFLVIDFSETVFPPMVGGEEGVALRSVAQSLAQRVTLRGPNGQIEGTVRYLESTGIGVDDDPGYYSGLFGAQVVFAVGVADFEFEPQHNYTLTLEGGALMDEWGLPVEGQQIQFRGPASGGSPVVWESPSVGEPTGPVREAVSSLGNRLLFHGQYCDWETGLVYMRARHYDPQAGEFLQRDPVDFVDSPNPYAAFRHNPVGLRDPSGEIVPLLVAGATLIAAEMTLFEGLFIWQDYELDGEFDQLRAARFAIDVATLPLGVLKIPKAVRGLVYALEGTGALLGAAQAHQELQRGETGAAIWTLAGTTLGAGITFLPSSAKAKIREFAESTMDAVRPGSASAIARRVRAIEKPLSEAEYNSAHLRPGTDIAFGTYGVRIGGDTPLFREWSPIARTLHARHLGTIEAVPQRIRKLGTEAIVQFELEHLRRAKRIYFFRTGMETWAENKVTMRELDIIYSDPSLHKKLVEIWLSKELGWLTNKAAQQNAWK